MGEHQPFVYKQPPSSCLHILDVVTIIIGQCIDGPVVFRTAPLLDIGRLCVCQKFIGLVWDEYTSSQVFVSIRNGILEFWRGNWPNWLLLPNRPNGLYDAGAYGDMYVKCGLHVLQLDIIIVWLGLVIQTGDKASLHGWSWMRISCSQHMKVPCIEIVSRVVVISSFDLPSFYWLLSWSLALGK